MEIRNLTTFVRAAELKSFSQAARQLGYSQSAVSMQISQLETELETSLFDRVGKTIALTPQGQRLFGYAQNILRMVESARADMGRHSAVSGSLRIAMAASICMTLFPSVIERYHALYPDVTLLVQSGTTEEMFRALAQNDVDMIYHLDNRIYRSDMMIPVVTPAPIIFVAPKGHPLAGVEAVPPQRLTEEAFILTEKGMSYRSQLDDQLAEMGLEIRPFLEVGDTDVIAGLVERGLGLSFLPEFTVRRALKEGTVERINVPEINVALYTQLIYHKGKWITPAMEAMIGVIQAEASAAEHG